MVIDTSTSPRASLSAQAASAFTGLLMLRVVRNAISAPRISASAAITSASVRELPETCTALV